MKKIVLDDSELSEIKKRYEKLDKELNMTRNELIRARLNKAEAEMVDRIQAAAALGSPSEVVRFCIRSIAGQMGVMHEPQTTDGTTKVEEDSDVE